MRTNYVLWIGLFIVAGLVTLATKYFAYFPGDVAVERGVQSLVPPNLNWADGVSRTAEFPWILLILAFILCAVFLVIGWVARVALGAHWPSDVIISYYLGLLWAAFLIRFVHLTWSWT